MADHVGTVTFKGTEGSIEASVDSEGKWESDDTLLATVLNDHFGPDQYGPQDGFPAWAALGEVSRLFGGKVVDLSPVPEVDVETAY